MRNTLALFTIAGLLGGCSSGPEHAQLTAMSDAVITREVPAPGAAIRVGGSDEKLTQDSKGNYKASKVAIDTPLPEGYPAPTPPGAVEIKTYPSVRRAEVTGTSANPDRGMNKAFWPLFNHIKKHDIAMTTPVEMDYEGFEGSKDAQPDAWTMSFLYRTPELNEVGRDGTVTVRDAAAVTVAAIGLRGEYTMATMRRGMEQLEDWLSSNPQWEAAGSWRMLCYNGPKLAYWNKWAEVQIPVRPAKP